jgi:hypothetical protein
LKILKTDSEAASNFCSGFPGLSLMGRFSPVYIHGFGTTFRNTGGFKKTGISFLKRFNGRIFTTSDFIEARRNFTRLFFTKRQPKIVKTISAKLL